MDRNAFLAKFQHTHRSKAEQDFPLAHAGKPASVLIPLVDYGDQLKALFTVRASHLKHHGGQISFPGGKQERADKNLLETALRESQEEIGLPWEQVSIVGTLPQFRTVSGYRVLPYIGFVEPNLSLKLDENEVAEVFEVPLDYLLDQSKHLVHWVERNQNKHPVYFIQWQQYTIWGATAAFVRNLSNICYPD